MAIFGLKQKNEKQKSGRPSIERLFLPGLLVYMLICGYVLYFSASLFYEEAVKYSVQRSMVNVDSYSFWLGYLYGFPGLTGVLGGISVLLTGMERFHNIKILLFIPAAVWSTQLVIGNFRWGLTYWTEWLYLVPIMILCMFLLYCIVRKINFPYRTSVRE